MEPTGGTSRVSGWSRAVLASVVLVAGASLSGCGSSSGPTPEDMASLQARLVTLEDRVSGVEAVVGQVIIADPAAQLTKVEADLALLTSGFAAAQGEAAALPDGAAAEVDAARKAIADAQAAVDKAVANEKAEDAALADAVTKATEAVAVAKNKLAELKKKISDALASRSASPSPSGTSPSGSPST